MSVESASKKAARSGGRDSNGGRVRRDDVADIDSTGRGNGAVCDANRKVLRRLPHQREGRRTAHASWRKIQGQREQDAQLGECGGYVSGHNCSIGQVSLAYRSSLGSAQQASMNADTAGERHASR